MSTPFCHRNLRGWLLDFQKMQAVHPTPFNQSVLFSFLPFSSPSSFFACDGYGGIFASGKKATLQRVMLLHLWLVWHLPALRFSTGLATW